MKYLSRFTWWLVVLLYKSAKIPSLAWAEFKNQKIFELFKKCPDEIVDNYKNRGWNATHELQQQQKAMNNPDSFLNNQAAYNLRMTAQRPNGEI